MIYAGGLKYILLAALIYLPGSLFYIAARREQRLKIFTTTETYIFIAIIVGALAAIYSIAVGLITI